MPRCGHPAQASGPDAGPDALPSGHGLSGLRERAAAAGGTIGVARSALGGFALRVRMP